MGRLRVLMGSGDNLMATGMARGAAARGKRIAFGDGLRVKWDQNSEAIFLGNPNIARPGSERAADIEWIPFYKGHRIYNKEDRGRWIWNYQFRAMPGEVFFTKNEKWFYSTVGSGFVVVEPNVPQFKSCAANKTWPLDRYEQVAEKLRAAGTEVVQFDYGKGNKLRAARHIKTADFRRGLAVMKMAALYVGPEGGLHHGAAALGIPAVVLFGGFVPPAVTGYPEHVNLTGGAEACGSLRPCEHCAGAMQAISVDEVYTAALDRLT